MKQTRPSICRICPSYCPILVTVEDGRAVDVKGDPRAPLYDGYTCPKGRALPAQHNAGTRLFSSLKRNSDGSHEAIASETAMDEIAVKLREIIEKYGPRAVALYMGTGQCTFPEVGAIASGWMKSIGSPMIFSANTIDKPGAQLAQAAHGMWSAWHPPFETADTWIVVGLNPIISKSGGFPPNNPGRRLKDAIRRGMKLVVIDPRLTETAKRAHIHLRVRPGQDPAVLAALINVIVREELYDRAFIAENVTGFDALAGAVTPFTPESVAEWAGVSATDLIETARLFAGSRNAGIGSGIGPSFSLTGTLTDYLILCLYSLCGFWSREGDACQKPNVLLPAFTPRAEAKSPYPGWGYDRKLRVRGLGLSASGWPTAALAEEILLDGDGQIRALLCLGGNPMMAWPDQKLAMKALQSLDLLVTNDWEMSATARLSHYVIAPKLSLESPNTSAILESFKYIGHNRGIDGPYARYTPKIVDPPPGSDLIEDWELYYGLAKRIGGPLDVTMTYGGEHAEAPPHTFTIDLDHKPSTDELLELLFQNSRVPLAEIKKYPHGHVFHDADQVVQPKRAGHAGMLDVANQHMMDRLAALSDLPPAVQEPSQLILLPRRTNRIMNSAGRNLPVLTAGCLYNPAFMSPQDLGSLGISPGDHIKIESQHGSIIGIAQEDDSVPPGYLSITHGYGGNPGETEEPELVGCNVGRLISTDAEFDPINGIPRMGGLLIKIELLRRLNDSERPTEHSAEKTPT